MNEQMERIEKMLRAQLKSAAHIWWVSGYVYGMTSNGDLFIILYPAAENLKEKVVRVYDQDFKKLPRYILTEGIDGGDTEANPSKEQARKKGIYHECPAFEIVTYDGKDTQMGKERRFGDVLRLSKAAREALAGGQQARPGTPPEDVDAPTRTASQSHQTTLLHPSRPLSPGPGGGSAGLALPDYQAMSVKAKTAAEFDYTAYMTLQDEMYNDQERITKTREVIVAGWKPGERANEAMLQALVVYRENRRAAESRGESPGAAHMVAKREAMGAYNREIGQT